MKNLQKTILAFFLATLLLFSFPATVFAYEYAEPNPNSMVEFKKVGKKETRKICASQINKIKNTKARQYKAKTEKEKFVELLSALDVEVMSSQLDYISTVVSLSEIESMQTSTIYSKIDQNGDETVLDKEAALTAASAAETNIRTSNIDHRLSPEKISSDGYMKQQILLLYTPDLYGNQTTTGRYVVFGIFQWLTTPLNRWTDAVSIGSLGDLNWYNKGADNRSNYGMIMGYTMEIKDSANPNNNSIQEITHNIPESQADVTLSKGAYFTYDLPNNVYAFGANTQSIYYKDFTFIANATGRVHLYGYAQQQLSVGISYVHIRTTLKSNISYNWLENKMSLTPVTVGTTKKTYEHMHTWDYSLDYNM